MAPSAATSCPMPREIGALIVQSSVPSRVQAVIGAIIPSIALEMSPRWTAS